MKKILSVLLFLSLMLSLFLVGSQAAGNKVEKTRLIAVVFDNSGSMFLGENVKAGSRATYATEVFASMMNPEDTLLLYPMNPMTSNNAVYTMDEPLQINGPDESTIIRSLQTPMAGITPIETIEKAYQGLKSRSADEKWLVVLTDGDYFYEGEDALVDTQGRLSADLSACAQSVNVQYLGIGRVAAKPEIVGGSVYRAEDSAQVLSQLTTMCNQIFGRDELNVSYGNTLNFDLPMRKLIVFAQGESLSNVSVGNYSPLSMYEPRYSEQPCTDERYMNNPVVDTSLQGVIAIFENVDAGEYPINCSGTPTSIGVYFEPDVDLKVELIDANGQVVSASQKELYAGEYTLRYGLVDRDGNPTNSALLKNTNYDVSYSINGASPVTSNGSNAGEVKLSLQPGDQFDPSITVTYLSGYSITKDKSNLNWAFLDMPTLANPADPLTLKISGGKDSYKLSELDTAEYYVELYYDDVKLTASDLASAELTAQIESGKASCTVTPNGDGYTVRLGHIAAATETECGEYTLTLRGQYTNEEQQVADSGDYSVNFTVEDDRFGLKLKLNAEQTYYETDSFDDAEPIVAKLSKDGAPLTDEELALVLLEIDTDGIKYETELLNGESAVLIRLLETEDVETGDHTITCKASMTDPLGQLITSKDDVSVEVQDYPQWLRWVILAAILALLITAWIIWRSKKILPKYIMLDDEQTKFTVRASEITGTARVGETKFGKSTGTFSFRLPESMYDELSGERLSLDLEAISPRRVKSADREAKVKNLFASGGITSVLLGGTTYKVNKEGKLVSTLDPEDEITISDSTMCTINGKVERISYSISTVIKFE